MKQIFKPGDTKTFYKTVTADEIAKFESGTVHELYSTFSIARDAEWCTRLFVLDMKDDDEEGIGTMVHIDHTAPAKIGSEVMFTAKMESMVKNELICNFIATCEDRTIAKGKTGQKILKKKRLEHLLGSL